MSERIPPGSRVVVGVDGSGPSKHALRWAACMARVTGARLHAVTAWHLPSTYGMSYVPSSVDFARNAEKMLTETVDEVFGAERPADLVLDVYEGVPSRVLLRAGQGAEMIVVGSRGHGAVASLLLGAVSRGVAEHAPCPVLVVHGDQQPPEVRP